MFPGTQGPLQTSLPAARRPAGSSCPASDQKPALSMEGVMAIESQVATRELARSKPNGQSANANLKEVDRMPLPANRIAAVESGLTEYQHTLAERDRLNEELRQTEHRYRVAVAEVEIRDRTIKELQRRVAELEADRDRKVGDFAVMETLFMSIRAQLDAFVKLPAAGEVPPPSTPSGAPLPGTGS